VELGGGSSEAAGPGKRQKRTDVAKVLDH
jgi:hypothetical protein